MDVRESRDRLHGSRPFSSGPAPNDSRFIRVDDEETGLREIVRQNGGRWDKSERAWTLRYADIKRLGLTARILDKMNQ